MLTSCELGRREGYEGHTFRLYCAGWQCIHYRFRQLPNRVGGLPIMGCRPRRWQPFRTTPPYSAEGRVQAVRSAVTLQLQHLRHLRWQVACATRVRRRPIASVLWTNVRGTDAKPYVARVHRRSTNADALGDHPRHRTHYWYQCPGRVPQALVPMSGPGQACPNTGCTIHYPFGREQQTPVIGGFHLVRATVYLLVCLVNLPLPFF